jgi:hypothetical protein
MYPWTFELYRQNLNRRRKIGYNGHAKRMVMNLYRKIWDCFSSWTHTVWLLESSSLSPSEGMSDDISKFCLAVILFHSFSTRKNTHCHRLSISRAAMVNTVR